jgi:hypothetical protein
MKYFTIVGPQGEILLVRYSEDQPRDKDGRFGSGGVYEKAFGKIGDVKTADEVVSSVGNMQAYDVLKSRGGMDAKFVLKDIPVGSVKTSNKTEKETVKTYAEKTGTAPPIVVYEGEIIDGNHRMAAAKERGDKTIKAYVGYKNEESERSLRFNADQPRDKDGKFTMGNVASFKNESEGTSAHVTSYNGRLHVTLVDDDSGNVIGSSIFSGDGMKDKAIEKAQKLAGVNKRFNEDQPRDPDGKFASGGGSVEEKPDEVKQVEALQEKMYEIERQAAAMESAHWKASQEEFWDRLNGLSLEHEALLKQIQELKNTGVYKEWATKQEQQRTVEHKAAVEKEVARVAKEQNYERVQVLTKEEGVYPQGFTVAGEHMDAGGYADLTTGQITIISTAMSVDFVPSIMAHEIEHERFQGALNAYNYEHQALMKIPGDDLFGKMGAGTGVLKASGEVRPEYQNKYPVTTLLQKSLEQDKFKLYDSDGCTKYSEAYWKHYIENGRRSADGERAMHETLAEMARVKVTTGKFPEGSNTGWRDLYRAVDKVAKTGNALWPNGQTPSHYVTGED